MEFDNTSTFQFPINSTIQFNQVIKWLKDEKLSIERWYRDEPTRNWTLKITIASIGLVRPLEDPLYSPMQRPAESRREQISNQIVFFNTYCQSNYPGLATEVRFPGNIIMILPLIGELSHSGPPHHNHYNVFLCITVFPLNIIIALQRPTEATVNSRL